MNLKFLLSLSTISSIFSDKLSVSFKKAVPKFLPQFLQTRFITKKSLSFEIILIEFSPKSSLHLEQQSSLNISEILLSMTIFYPKKNSSKELV